MAPEPAPQPRPTTHRFLYGSRQALSSVAPASVALVVTSPPYPMIEMWDAAFSGADPVIGAALASGDGRGAFDLMHRALEPVWREMRRVLVPGGIACINIGDAVRSIGGDFQLFNNHARILETCQRLGFASLPCLIWRKPTNAPNKFMGSGMLPAGCYVTLEHEYILILRNGGRRRFAGDEAAERRRSAFFWEERNHWFSDQWDLTGARQRMQPGGERERSAAFPLLIPYRLVLMFSIYGDTVLDPFCGTGTTSLAALAAARNSIGVEIEARLLPEVHRGMSAIRERANELAYSRLRKHLELVGSFEQKGRKMRHWNAPHGFPVTTSQEQDMEILSVTEVEETEPGLYLTRYEHADVTRFAQGELF